MAAPPGKQISIRWNGKEVSDPAELPPEVRKLIEDADGNGIPDIAERGKTGAGGPGDVLEVKVVESTVIEMGGKQYSTIEDLPPELRGPVRDALARLNPSQAGSPSSAPSVPSALPAAAPRPVGPSWLVLLLAGIAGAVLVYFLLHVRR